MQTKLDDFNSPEKTEILSVFESIPMMEKWIACVIEHFIYAWIEEYYSQEEGGKIRCRYLTKYGEKHGKYTEWFDDGQLFEQSSYINGKLHGEYKRYFWNEDGDNNIDKLCSHTTYTDGIIHGEYKSWYCEVENQLFEQSIYVNGKLHGEYRRWYDNGELHIQTTYKNGELHGEYREWNFGLEELVYIDEIEPD
jgi:antitoxin component YwqK of YwqJK toxin-antitoxin module